MKTYDELVAIATAIREYSETLPESVERLQQIQLDAMKEGMRRAAEVCDNFRMGTSSGWVNMDIHKEAVTSAILSAAEQLTEKDL